MSLTIFWHRRDLRLEDNAGLYQALKHNKTVLPLFIFDKQILDKLEDKDDARVSFIHESILSLQRQLKAMGSSILVRYGNPGEVWEDLIKEFEIVNVYTNRDYEPYALDRDTKVKEILARRGIPFRSYKDQVIFDRDEVVKDDGKPYTVFTPYSRKWKANLQTRMLEPDSENGPKKTISYFLQSYPTDKYFSGFKKVKPFPVPSLEEIGFEKSTIEIPGQQVNQGLIRHYADTRDFPALKGTSRLGIHFRFGTISIREKARKARGLSETYLNELIWRDFYSMILYHFPHVVENPFREKYRWIEWRNDPREFELWCQGKTGYPIVDAGMRELNATGYMHNRVRMIVASFLTKHLLIDWRWGEAYFARKLLDFDLASNNGGWQWAAGCGTDAAPYFRIFNPYSQQKKFDKEMSYIRKWIPEYGQGEYPEPVVDHKFARERCLETYKKGLTRAETTD